MADAIAGLHEGFTSRGGLRANSVLPPDDPAELADFPARTVPADYPYSRIHHDRHEPEWFCDTGDCRFDASPGAGFRDPLRGQMPLAMLAKRV